VSERAAFCTPALSKERIAQFSLAMHDANPVHLDEEFCRSIGLAGIIAPGGISVVAVAHAVALRYGLESVAEIDLSFRSPIQVGESLRCTHELIEDHGDVVVLSVAALGEDGRICAEGTVRARRGAEERG
jgi:acyl dehydratase